MRTHGSEVSTSGGGRSSRPWMNIRPRLWSTRTRKVRARHCAASSVSLLEKSMTVIDRAIWEAALTALSANTLKTSLTTLGVVIGSASIVLVVSASLTGKRYIVEQIEAVGANLVYAERVKSSSEQDQVMALADEMTLADLDAVRTSIPEVVEIAGTHEIPATVVVRGAEHSVTLVGVTEGFQRIRNLVILNGRFLDADDMGSRVKVCLLTKELSATLFSD